MYQDECSKRHHRRRIQPSAPSAYVVASSLRKTKKKTSDFEEIKYFFINFNSAKVFRTASLNLTAKPFVADVTAPGNLFSEWMFFVRESNRYLIFGYSRP
jgi:hypothetical protein